MRATEGVEDPSAGIHGEAFGRERRARDVAAEVFEPAAAIRGHGNGRVQREPGSEGQQGIERRDPEVLDAVLEVMETEKLLDSGAPVEWIPSHVSVLVELGAM
jgi:hypothetical protein